MKKLTALFLSMLLIALVLTGCSSDELGFYKTAKSIESLKNYSYSGSIKMSVNKLEANPAATDGTADSTEDLTLLKALLNNATVTYDGSVDSTHNRITFNLSMNTGDDSLATKFHLILDNSKNGSLLDISPEASLLIESELNFTPKPVTINGILYDQYDIFKIINQLNTMPLSTPAIATPPYDESTDKADYMAYTDGFSQGYADGYKNSDDNSEINYPDGGPGSDGYEDGYQQGWTNYESDSNISSMKLMVPYLQSLTTVTKTTSDQQALQSKLMSLTDNLMNTYFKNLTLGLVKKTGNSTYSSQTTLTGVYGAIEKVMKYIEANPAQLKATLITFAKSLSTSQVELLKISGVDTQKELLGQIDQMDLSNLETDLQTMDEQLSGLTDGVDPKINFSLQKTGSQSYSISDSLSIDNTHQTGADYFMNLSISQNTLISGGVSGDIGSTVLSTDFTSSKPSLSLKVTDPDVVETGMLIAADKYMNSPTKLKALKQGNSYVDNLSGLKKDVIYYYQVYTVDSAGNLLSSKTNSFAIDKLAPNVSAVTSNKTGVRNGGFVNKNVVIAISDSALKSRSITLNGRNVSWPSDNTLSSKGKYVVTAKDEYNLTTTFTFTIDKTAPIITVKNLSGAALSNAGSSKGEATISYSDTNYYSRSITLNGKSTSWPSNGRVTKKGTYAIAVSDMAGNKSAFTFKVIQ